MRRPSLPVNALSLAFLIFAPVVQAKLFEAFTVESAWPASDVVEVKETNKLGRFEVTVSWKGDVAPGSIIDVPAMIPLQSNAVRRLPDWDHSNLQEAQILLFLRDQSSQQSNEHQWIPASSDMKLSMVFLKDNKTFCFLPDQTMTLLQLRDCRLSLEQMWTAVGAIKQEQRQLETIREMPNKQMRAEALAPFLFSKYWIVRSFVFKQIEACGRDGVPTVVAILRDPTLLDQHSDAIKILVNVEGAGAGPELTALLDSEVGFWKAVGPTMTREWWNESGSPQGYLSRRLNNTMDLLTAVGGTRFLGARETIIELRDTWRSLPPLVPDVKRTMTEKCDTALSQLAPD